MTTTNQEYPPEPAVEETTAPDPCACGRAPKLVDVDPDVDWCSLCDDEYRDASRRFVVETAPSGRVFGVRDTAGSALRYNGRPTSLLTWEGMDEETARRIAEHYEAGFRPVA